MLSKRILIVLALAFLTLLVGCLTPTNQTPILTSDPITVATVGVEYTYNVNATDPEGDTLTYSFIDRPEGMVINSTTGVINWIPSFGQIGDNPVVVKVSDGTSSIAQSFIIEVSKFPINQAPIIYSVPITTATVGVTYVYDVEATDPDGDTLTYSLTTKPAGMTINSVTGVIWWIPYPTQVGGNPVKVKVFDGVLSDTQNFTITVSEPSVPPVNQKPIINSYPITTAIVGETYTYTINAFDPDGDILTYSVIDVKPIGMTINPANGFIWWVPTSAQIGDNLITVKVSDGVLSDTQSFIVKVSEPEPEPELTEITVLPKTMDLIVGGFETFEVTAHYDNDTTNIVTFKCLYGTSNSSIAYVAYGIDKVTTLAVGTATIFISYTQYNSLTGGEITRTDEIDVTVSEPVQEPITIRWLEDAVRYNADGSYNDDWQDNYIPSPNYGVNPAEFPATLILTGGEYHFADVQEYFNWDMEYEGSIVISETGVLSGYATYTLDDLPIQSDFLGQVEIIIGEGITGATVDEVVIDGDHDGIMVGIYTQLKYAFGTENEIIAAGYIGAYLCEGFGDKWFVGHTIYTAHGE